MGSTYAIGDVQGHYAELKQLLANINFDPKVDSLILLGDVVNRGPESAKVLKLLYKIRKAVTIVLGNHDLMTLAGLDGVVDANEAARQIQSKKYGKPVTKWLRSQPLYYELETINRGTNKRKRWTCTHAGIPPQWSKARVRDAAKAAENLLHTDRRKFYKVMLAGKGTVANNSKPASSESNIRYTVNALTRMRQCTDNGQLVLNTNNEDAIKQPTRDWFNWPSSVLDEDPRVTILFGHYALLHGRTNHKRALCLETGVSWGNELTALCLETRKRTVVSAH